MRYRTCHAPWLARLATAGCLMLAAAGLWATEPVDRVDPFIGTGGHGHTYPGATLPFGMVQLSPDTRLTGWDGCSGYHWTDRVVYGFSHTHLSGTGVSDYGDILLMPVTGEPRLASGYGGDPNAGYGSRFDKRTERAGAGWYAVELADYGIAVELTATERAGFHRYRLPAGRPAHVIVDLEHRDEVLDSELIVAGEREIAGFRRSTGWARDQIVYFVARFSRPFRQARLALDGELRRTGRTAPSGVRGRSVKGVLSFGDGGGELMVKVGISAVDVEGARRNLDAELPGWSFDATRAAARQRWAEALERVAVSGGTPEQRTVFYTALYHSLLAPNLFSDVDGRYRGMDRAVHRAQGRRHYTVFSLWDTFRATHPLFTLIEPERTREMVETFLAQYDQGGRLPVWELAGNETDTMIGYHAVSVIAEAWLKGIRGYDAERALEAMVASADGDRFGLEAYRRQGFIGAEDDGESVSKTLEYAYDDACIAAMAEGLGKRAIAERFARRSQAWRHLLDPETGFMRPRRNQGWLEPFDPRRVDNHYTEANAWQYSFFVPQDVAGLIAALGGDQRFVERLDALFAAPSATTGRDQADITGLIGQYAHGNEPSHHMAWLYHYAGQPGRSAERVRQILDTLYAAAPDGLSGNEDCGQMSSWFVLAAIGLYPVCPCSDEYLIGAPLFERVDLALAGGRRFTVRTEGAAEGHLYVQSATLDGRRLGRSFLRYGEIAAGGELVLRLGPSPAPDWGVATADRPRSRVEGDPVVPAPFVVAAGEVFRDSLTVELGSADRAAEIRYRLTPLADGAGAPAGRRGWQRYEAPLVVRSSARLEMLAERDGRSSPLVAARFHRIPHDWRVEVSSPVHPQYTAGGPEALIDALRGSRNWRTGGWQGYQGTDFEAVVDLGEVRQLRRAGAGFLQDARSWIWMPAEVVVAVSTDGESFRELARLDSGVPDDLAGVVTRDLVADLAGVAARWIRLSARNYGTVPDWHPGRGGAAYIFVDEILVEPLSRGEAEGPRHDP